MKKNITLRALSVFFLLVVLSALVSCIFTNQDDLYYSVMQGGYMVEPSPIATSLEGFAQKLLTRTSLNIPSHYLGESVVGIRGFAIYPALTDVTIPDTIRYIEKNAFGPSVQYNEYENALYLGNESNPYVALMKLKDTNAEACHIHKDTKVIANDAFANCDNIKDVYYEGDIEGWMNGYFFNDNDSNPMKNGANLYFNNELVKDIRIPEGVTMPDGVFDGCISLTSIEIPDSYRYAISCEAFKGCTSLTTVNIGDSVPLIEERAFQNCDSLINVFFSENSSVERIKNGAFENCKSLTDIYLPASLTTIRENAFKDCTSLNHIYLSESITNISEKAFVGCDSIEYNEYYGGRYLGNESNPFIALIKAPDAQIYEIAEGTKLIHKSAFAESSSLAEVTIPNSVRTIDDYAFKNCVLLVGIVIPDSVDHLGWGVFDGCVALKDVTLSKSIKRIDVNAFRGCESLKSIMIPDSVTYIGMGAFEDCTSLTSIIFDGMSKRWNNIVFDEDWKINVPATEVVCSDGKVSLK